MEILNRTSDYCYQAFRQLSRKENRGYVFGGMVTSGFYGTYWLSPIKDIFTFFTIAVILKGLLGLVYIGMGGMVTKILNDIWSEKIKPKLKFFKNGKKDDNEKAA